MFSVVSGSRTGLQWEAIDTWSYRKGKGNHPRYSQQTEGKDCSGSGEERQSWSSTWGQQHEEDGELFVLNSDLCDPWDNSSLTFLLISI